MGCTNGGKLLKELNETVSTHASQIRHTSWYLPVSLKPEKEQLKQWTTKYRFPPRQLTIQIITICLTRRLNSYHAVDSVLVSRELCHHWPVVHIPHPDRGEVATLTSYDISEIIQLILLVNSIEWFLRCSFHLPSSEKPRQVTVFLEALVMWDWRFLRGLYSTTVHLEKMGENRVTRCKEDFL